MVKHLKPKYNTGKILDYKKYIYIYECAYICVYMYMNVCMYVCVSRFR